MGVDQLVSGGDVDNPVFESVKTDEIDIGELIAALDAAGYSITGADVIGGNQLDLSSALDSGGGVAGVEVKTPTLDGGDSSTWVKTGFTNLNRGVATAYLDFGDGANEPCQIYQIAEASDAVTEPLTPDESDGTSAGGDLEARLNDNDLEIRTASSGAEAEDVDVMLVRLRNP